MKRGKITGKSLQNIIYEILQGRRFDYIEKENEGLYSAWCLRIAETVIMRLENEGFNLDEIGRNKNEQRSPKRKQK